MPRYEQRNPAPKPRPMTPPPVKSGKDKPTPPPRNVPKPPKPGEPGYVPGTGTGGLREIDPDTGELRRPAVPRKPDNKPGRGPGRSGG